MTAGLQDQAARDRIVGAHDANLFVDAGAGSGKTKQLVDRVVSIIALGSLESVGGLAAITFTENAATELRTRIREALEDAAAADGRPADQRARCARALEELDDAAITTLHGFAARLLTDAPIEAGLPPGFRIQDAVRTSIDRDAWWLRLLDDWYADEALAGVWRVGLTLDLRPEYLREVLAAFDGNWDLLADHPIAVQPMPAIDAAALLAPLRQLVAYAGGRAPGGDRLTERVDEVLTPLLQEAATEADPLQVLAVLRDADLRGSPGNAGAWASAGLDKATACAFLDEARTVRAAQITACKIAVTTALAELLRQAVLEHASKRRDRGELWFHDLLVYAVRLLRDDDGVRAALRQRWQVVCVDEFQDTDPLQVELVHLIAGLGAASWADAVVDGGRLFFVGDPKQSIYRFRRAEVGLFAQVRDRYDDGRLSLVQNFRSRPGVLRVVNEVFGQLGDDMAVGYEPLQAARQDVGGDPGPDVLVLGGPSAQRIGDIRQVEADHVASTLARARGSWLVGDGPETTRPASFGDMAILVPTRTSLGQLEDALDRHGVPYRVMSRSLVWESDAVRDLITVLQSIDDPADSVALVAALRHPMFGCSDDDLIAWKTAGGRWRYDAPAPEGTADSPVADALAALRRYHDLRWWLPVNVLLDRIIRERRGVELTAAYRRPRDHWRRLRFLVDQARLFLDSGGAGVTGFVRWAREQIDSAADAIETVVPERDDDAVQILTIHGSKGLEFPIVALTGINTTPMPPGHVIWPPGAPPEITLNKEFKTPGFGAAQLADKALGQQEDLRLLYVGMTRAADHLIVSLHHHPPQHGRADTHAMRLFQLLADSATAGAVHEPSALPVHRHAPEPATTAVDASAESRQRFIAAREELLSSVAMRLPTTPTGLATAAAGESQEPADPLEAGSSESADPAAQRPVARSGATLGSAVHRALEILDLTAVTDQAADQATTAACAELGVLRLAGEVRSRVQSALTAQIVQLAATHRHWKEVPIIAELGGRVVEGFIDLVVDTDDGLVVVDYKTDSVASQADIQTKTQHYAPQIRAYAEALALATGLRAAPPQLLFCRSAGVTSVVV